MAGWRWRGGWLGVGGVEDNWRMDLMDLDLTINKED